MTSADKKKLFAAIAKEFIAENGANPIPVEDEDSNIGYFVPFFGKAEIISPDEHSPYLDEIRERAKTADQSIPLEEFIKRFAADEED
jgi:hypothetical protein